MRIRTFSMFALNVNESNIDWCRVFIYTVLVVLRCLAIITRTCPPVKEQLGRFTIVCQQ